MSDRRKALIKHLERIHAGGRIQEAVFTENWRSWGWSTYRTFAFSAPKVETLDPLPEPRGMPELSSILAVLENWLTDDEEDLRVTATRDTLKLGSPVFGDFDLGFLRPETTGGFITKELREQIFDPPDLSWVGVPDRVIAAVTRGAQALGVEEVRFVVEETGSRVELASSWGDRQAFNRAVVPFSALDRDRATCELLFKIENLEPVFSAVAGPPFTDLCVDPVGLLRVRHQGYHYVFSALKEHSLEERGDSEETGG